MPQRRCVGCGRTTAKSELVRLALEPGAQGPHMRAVRDRGRVLAGRGAYLCSVGATGEISPACLEQAIRRRGIQRALRSAAPLDREIVESVGQ